MHRVPIIVTGNDLSRIFAPLVRDGRMAKFYWKPTREDLVSILHQMYRVSCWWLAIWAHMYSGLEDDVFRWEMLIVAPAAVAMQPSTCRAKDHSPGHAVMAQTSAACYLGKPSDHCQCSSATPLPDEHMLDQTCFVHATYPGIVCC